MKKSLYADVTVDNAFHVSSFSNKKDAAMQSARDLFETIVGCTIFLVEYAKEADNVFVNCLEDRGELKSNLKNLLSNCINIINKRRVEEDYTGEPSYCTVLEKSAVYFLYLEDHIAIAILKQMFSLFEGVQTISLKVFIYPQKKEEFRLNFRLYQSKRGPCLVSEG